MELISTAILEYPYELHWALTVIAALIWCFRQTKPGKTRVIADILSAASIVAVWAIYVLFSIEQQEESPFSQRGWFIFFSMVTTGLLPVLTATAHWFFGRGIGRIVRIIYKKWS